MRDEDLQQPLDWRERGRGVEWLQPDEPEGRRPRQRDAAQRRGEASARLAPVVGELDVVQGLEQPVGDRAQQLVAACEVVVDRHPLHVQLGAEPAHAERGRAVALDQRYGGVEDPLAVQGAPSASPLRRCIDGAGHWQRRDFTL